MSQMVKMLQQESFSHWIKLSSEVKEYKDFVICQVKIVKWVAYYGRSSVKIVTFTEIVAKVAKKVKTVRQDPGWSSSLEKSPSNTNVSHS